MPPAASAAAPLKCVVGLANDTFVACFGRIEANQQLRFGKETTFANAPTGFVALLAWAAQPQPTAAPLWFVVEATGVYVRRAGLFSCR